jgi:dTDP-4-amino-4,6-dideoxygalactose transaminase
MYGQAGRYEHVAHGVNSRLDELQAAFLRAKLTHLHDWHARRNAIAGAYDDALAGRSARPLAKLPDREHAYHLYVAVTEDRERLQAAMTDAGVGTLVHYPRPVHGHEPYRALGEGVPLSNAEWLADRVVSLPLYPDLTDAEVE